LTRIHSPYSDYRDYIPFKETLDQAAKINMSVGEYIDSKHNVPGSTQETVDQMIKLGVFSHNIDRVCEIGPGSGRYLEKILKICRPSYYEGYETATDWARWLSQTYPIVMQPTDGMSLSATPTSSIDLVHTHKVLPGQPSLTICRYFLEMLRVTRSGGKIVFDIVTETCLSDDLLELWLQSGSGYQHYPSFMSKQFTINFFRKRDCSYDGEFCIAMKPGITNYLVFTKS